MEDIDINELKNLNKYWIENVSDSEKIELEGLSEKEIIDRYYTEGWKKQVLQYFMIQEITHESLQNQQQESYLQMV